MKKIKYINESENNIVVKIIGDHIANMIDNSDDYLTSDIHSKNMSVKSLINKLRTEERIEGVDYIILSIGANDYFSSTNNVAYLCDLIIDIYPKAEYYIIEGFLGFDDIIDFTEEDYIELEKQRFNFYSEFSKNGFDVIETDELVSQETLEDSSTEILKIKNKISLLTIGDVNMFDINQNDENDDFSSNVKVMNNSDDETDFDTIYEFLDRFYKIVKSKKIYSINNNSSSYNPNVHQIEIAIKFLLSGNIFNFRNDGVFDNQTENAIKKYQQINGLDVTGIADIDTIEDIFYDLKVFGFDDDDLGNFLNDENYNGETFTDKKEIYLNGKVDTSNAGLSGEQLKNVNIMIDYMYKEGITNPYTQIGILSVIGKESGYIPQNEICYDGTSDARIKEVFGFCRTNDIKIKKDWSIKYGTDVTITDLKYDCEDFFDAVYGKQATTCLGWSTGNDNTGDGYKYRGRGFNGITFKSLYKKYGDIIGVDLLSDPDKLNNPDIAAKAAVAFFTSGNPVPEFDNKQDATNYFVNKNAGGTSKWKESFENANAWMSKYEVIP
jgi:peptidoglycan hydrolase-like protein with peptidoglycan-binding domain